ncbi:MAG: hypothetical protein KDK78_01920 [Chlamydiia bacterium]|nr:hypothetical protein [Chlamydiia bacterium]
MAQSEFLWQQQPEAEGELQAILKHACNKNQTLRQLDHDLIHISSTRLIDWIDHYSLPMKDATMKRLTAVGYQTCEDSEKRTVLNHPGAVLPMISLRKDKGSQTGVAVKVESIASYQQAHGLSGTIEGSPLSGFRRCLISSEGGVDFYVTERRGTRTLDPTFEDSSYLSRYHQASELWKGRARGLPDSDEAMQRTEACVDRMVQLVGKDLAAWIAMEGEREYWQGRNTAGHVQKGRQDRLGMGWANHDHHTFRSSRHFFRHLVNLMEKMGFHCRERFYAGKEAGWGAQVMENSTCGIVLFLDVDLAPEELHIDFAHDPLPDLGRLGTIGLWCALHGDSVLNAGMHHLEVFF